jgi:hypothetical protein
MRKLYTGLLALAVVVWVAAPAQAQRQQGQGGRGGFTQMSGYSALLTNESVQKELRLDEGQVAKVKDAVKTVTDKYKDETAKVRELQGDERRTKQQELTKEVTADTLKAIGEILKPDQLQRLDQIRLQASGYRAFSRPEVQSALKLTDEQKENIKTITDDAAKALQALGGGGQGSGRRRNQGGQGNSQRTAIQKETMDKIGSVLTDPQKKTWKDMTGDPFTLVRTRSQRGNSQNN